MIAISLCLIFAIFQVAVSDIPPHCRGPPPHVNNDRECCKLPKLFSEEDLKACGIEKHSSEMKERKASDCSKAVCLMNRFELMKDDTNVDKEALAAFLDKYADENTDIKNSVEIAKQKCLEKDITGFPDICEPRKMAICIAGVMIMNCPKFDDSEDCQKLRNHFEDCKKYYE